MLPGSGEMKPQDACGEYLDYDGHQTWIKNLDARIPEWALAYVWSTTTKRWRKRRERVDMDHVRLFTGKASDEREVGE